ncbi:hypothetical protein LXL04_016471 [Taraxacum kok-saghyz]
MSQITNRRSRIGGRRSRFGRGHESEVAASTSPSLCFSIVFNLPINSVKPSHSDLCCSRGRRVFFRYPDVNFCRRSSSIPAGARIQFRWRKGKKHSECVHLLTVNKAKNIVKVYTCDRTWMNKAKKQKKSQQIHEKEEESIDIGFGIGYLTFEICGLYYNSYIPENPKTPKPLTFVKNDFGRLKIAQIQTRSQKTFLKQNKKMCTYAKKKKKLHICKVFEKKSCFFEIFLRPGLYLTDF